MATLTPPETLHPDELRLELAGELSRGERRVYDKCWTWLTRRGAPRYLTLSRRWLARNCRVSISTVARAFAAMRRLGLLVIQERWKSVGNLRRQISNLIALPFGRPPERVKSRTRIQKLKKRTPNKVASGFFSTQTHSHTPGWGVRDRPDHPQTVGRTRIEPAAPLRGRAQHEEKGI